MCALLYVTFERIIHIVLALCLWCSSCSIFALVVELRWIHMLWYIRDMYSLLCFHYFILRALGLHQFFQPQPNQNKYIQEALDDSNTRQQCPEMEKEIVDVEMCEDPRIDKDTPLGSSLRWSSQKAAYDAIDCITSQVEEGACRKISWADGPRRGRPLVPPKCWNQLRWIPHMSQYQYLKLLKLMTM